MAFNFGGGGATKKPAAASTSAFSFGANTAPAPTTTAAPTAAAPAPGFSFAGSTPAPAPSAAAAPAFSLAGSAPAPTTTAAPATAAPASFSFGSSAPAPAPKTTAAPTTAAPTVTFSFGGSAPAPAASSTAAPATTAPASAFSFGGATPAPAASTTTTTTTTTNFTGATSSTSSGTVPSTGVVALQQATLTAPDFDAIFENLKIWNRTNKLCKETISPGTKSGTGVTSLAGQNLMHYLSTNATTALKPRVVEWIQPNNALRQQLAQNPLVGFSGDKPIILNFNTMEKIGLLSTELRIPEAQAITLYREVCWSYKVLNGLITSNSEDGGGGGFVDQALPGSKYDDIDKLARNFYFYERGLKLETILYLFEHRLQNNPDIVRATDTLLQEGQLIPNLIAVVRDYTQRIEQLQQEIKSTSTPATQDNAATAIGGSGGFLAGSLQQSQQQQKGQQEQNVSQFAKVHLMFCTKERQTAAEALVLIAYHTQLEVNEVTGLIDLIRDLSTGIPKLSPFNNVPSPYESTSDSMGNPYQQHGAGSSWPPATTNTSYNEHQWDRKDKSSLEWQKELIRETCRQGRPQLLKCYSLLVVTVIAAMETRQILYDRNLHGPNDFGKGNQLLHPNRPSLEKIKELHARLKPGAHEQWVRRDVWGLLTCSYAMLLRLTPLAITSPTKGGSSTPLSKEVRDAARDCIEGPIELMSFTFCRLTLIPSLRRINSASMRTMCNISEFCLSVVAEMYALYLNIRSEGTGNLPKSRKQWQDQAEEDLKLRREQYNDQLRFEFFLGTNVSESSKRDKIPSAVDLMERPECLDDLIALAADLCALGPNYSRSFWSKDNETMALVPSRPLQECILHASKDDNRSLIAYVYSWMAALSNDKESARAIHGLMSQNENKHTNSEAAVSSLTNWCTVISDLRFYVQLLNINSDSNLSKPSSPMTNNSTNNNTSYYYGLEGNVIPDSSSDSRSRDGRGRTKSSSSSSSSKKASQELSENARLRVASSLALIMNVSLHCFEARYSILSINLPISEGDLTAGGDGCLMILFKLAVVPLTPQMRGATLSTIASLLHSTEGIKNDKIKSFLEEQGNSAWEYLDCCSILPIDLLDRYRVVKHTGTDIQDIAVVAFPPSSMVLASLPSRTESNLKKHPMYGILYELDHIESKKGWYPSTEGFLLLLESLFSSVGCPNNLGRWRVRKGCTPYLEYVLNFVLPKALGLNNQPAIPFRVSGDRSRLVSRALAVVEAILSRYNLPTSTMNNIKGSVESGQFSTLGIQSVFDQVCVKSNHDDAKQIEKDFKSVTVSSTLNAPTQQLDTNYAIASPISNQAFMGSSPVSTVPVPKSPGFTILAELLSSSCGVLLQALAVVLTECGGPKGVLSFYRDQSDKMDMTYALFGSTPPDLNSSKEGLKESGPTKPLQNLLRPFYPKFQKSNVDDHYVDSAVLSREKSVASALHILCAAMAREDAFIANLKVAKEQPLKLVPVIEFRDLKTGSNSTLAMDTNARDVRISSLSDLLFSMSNSGLLRSTIVQYIGYDSLEAIYKTEISAAALSIIYRLEQSTSPQTSLRSLYGNEPTTSSFAKAIADRLSLSSRSTDFIRDSEVLKLILNWILSELRSGFVATDGLAQALLGLPGDTSDGNWRPGRYTGAIFDCFDAILEIHHKNYASSGFSGVSSLCYEIFFRLYDLIRAGDAKSLKIAIYTAERLRHVGFWDKTVLGIRSAYPAIKDPKQCVQSLHSIGWLLKGLAWELRLLVGFAGDTISGSEFGRHLGQQPLQCDSLLASLYHYNDGIIRNLVECMPLEIVSVNPNLQCPSQEALRAGKVDLPGARDIVQGYDILDCKKVFAIMGDLSQASDIESMRKWVEEWNSMTNRECGVSHLTHAISVLIDASVYSLESISRCHTPLSDQSNFSHSWLHNNGSQDLLVLFLQRYASDYQEMDKCLVPVSTRNLSNVILTLSEFITSPNGADINASDLLEIAALLARTIPSSSRGNDTAEGAPLRYERTVSLGSALSILLRSSASLEPGFVSQHRDDFIQAAQVLAGISVFKNEPTKNDSHGIVSVLARGCVTSIILALSQIESEVMTENSSAYSCIPHGLLERSISLVADLDEDICDFLYVIALQPSGAKMLIDAGIAQALKSAARIYNEKERAVVQNLEGKSSSFTKTTIRTPEFLLSHFKLICALLTTAHSPEDQSNSFASKCIGILSTYQTTINRLCYNFPVQADYLRWLLKALVLAFTIVKPLKEKMPISNLNQNRNESIASSRFLNTGIVMVLEHLSVYPLPRDMFPDHIMPRELKNPQASVGSESIRVEKDNSTTWWDELQSILMSRQDSSHAFSFPAPTTDQMYISTQPRKWSEDTYEYSIVAADTLCLGLQLLKRTERSDLFIGSSLASGLFRCAFAAKTVDNRLDNMRTRTTQNMHSMETDDNFGSIELELQYLTMLARALAECVEQLLMLCLQFCDSKENKNEIFLKQIVVAVEASGIDRVRLRILTEERSEFITVLCEEIKKLCK